MTYKTLLQAACGSSGSVEEVKDLLAEMLGVVPHHGGLRGHSFLPVSQFSPGTWQGMTDMVGKCVIVYRPL